MSMSIGNVSIGKPGVFTIGAGLWSWLAVLTSPVDAQTFPDRPVTLVLAFPAGSGLDIVSRILSPKLTEGLGQPLIVDPKPGANGAIAAAYVARSAPTGHTIFMTTNSTHSANPHLMKQLAYDPIADFTPIVRIGNLPFMLVISPKIPARTFQEFVTWARANKGRLHYASTNVTGLVGGAMVSRIADLGLTNVAHKATPQALAEVEAGDIAMMFVDVATGLQKVRDGKLIALCVTTKVRSRLLPDLPSTAEVGLPDFDVNTWNGIFAPARTPKPIVDRLNQEFRKTVADQATFDRLAAIGFDAFTSSPEEFDAFVKAELVKWGAWIKDLGIQPE